MASACPASVHQDPIECPHDPPRNQDGCDLGRRHAARDVPAAFAFLTNRRKSSVNRRAVCQVEEEAGTDLNATVTTGTKSSPVGHERDQSPRRPVYILRLRAKFAEEATVTGMRAGALVERFVALRPTGRSSFGPTSPTWREVPRLDERHQPRHHRCSKLNRRGMPAVDVEVGRAVLPRWPLAEHQTGRFVEP